MSTHQRPAWPRWLPSTRSYVQRRGATTAGMVTQLEYVGMTSAFLRPSYHRILPPKASSGWYSFNPPEEDDIVTGILVIAVNHPTIEHLNKCTYFTTQIDIIHSESCLCCVDVHRAQPQPERLGELTRLRHPYDTTLSSHDYRNFDMF